MEATHVFVKGRQGGGIFYRKEDFLVYITIVSVLVRQLELEVLAFCPMFNHVHFLFKMIEPGVLRKFIQLSAHSFVREYNAEYGRKGALFQKGFGRSMKKGIKIILGCVAYVFNNPVAGRIARKASDYKWNLLAYMDNKSPFSKPVKRKHSRYALKVALKKIDYFHSSGTYIGYAALRNIFADLDKEEIRQATDYLLYKYSFISYTSLEELYGSREKLLVALDSNAGSEFDLEDEYGDHSVYRRMLKTVVDFGFTGRDLNFERLPEKEARALYYLIKSKANAPHSSICKFLHLDGKMQLPHYK
ncbi:MAG: transposase [Bacteroidales bacterium]|nr:transposase [Bacteroidales bacterium]